MPGGRVTVNSTSRLRAYELLPRALFESTSEPESESESGWTPRNARDLRLPIMVLVDSDAKTRPLSLSDTVVQPIVLVAALSVTLSGLYRPSSCRCPEVPIKVAVRAASVLGPMPFRVVLNR